jgi:Gpi18-like mannosyltransferase
VLPSLWKHVVIGLLLREALAPFTGHPYDLEVWARLGVYMQSLQNPYIGFPYYPGISFNPSPLTGSIGYPPLSAFMFGLTFWVYSLLGEPSRFLYYFFLKQPIVFSDIGCALVLARIVGLSKGAAKARTAFLIWTYFPLGIITSSLWGALDPIVVFLILLTVYYYSTSRYFSSAASLGIAIFLKTIPIIALPVFLAQPMMSNRKRVVYLPIALGIPVIGTLAPLVLLKWDAMEIVRNFSFQFDIQRYGGISPLASPLLVSFLPITLSLLAGILWIPALFAAYLYSYFRKYSLLQSLLVVFLAFIVARPFVSEQWALYPLGLLLAVSSKLDLRRFVGLSVPATIFLVANNTLLFPFFSPVSFTFAFYPLIPSRLIPMTLSILLFFVESLLILFARQSVVYGFLARVSSTLNMRNILRLRASEEADVPSPISIPNR